jgi:phenylacetate-CoA ligase
MYTTSACRQLAAKGFPITVVTPGNNFSEILRVVPKLAPLFDQVVLLGYPPFLKDVLERGASAGIQWAAYDVKLVMAGEVFSEAWRDLVTQRLGQIEPAYCSASLYGTADGGVLANETPASILVRRALAAQPALAQALFGQARLPTLCQYDPRDRYFEQLDGELVFSGDGGVPLIRYNILDRGGLVTHAAMREFLDAHGLLGEPMRAELDRFQLPFVYVFGRNNFAVSHYGANVFPENIAIGLEQPAVEHALTGKFVLEVFEDAVHDSVLQVTVELASGHFSSEQLAAAVAHSVLANLQRVNSEFANYVPKERQAVRIQLLPLGDADYFPVGVKHRYTR